MRCYSLPASGPAEVSVSAEVSEARVFQTLSLPYLLSSSLFPFDLRLLGFVFLPNFLASSAILAVFLFLFLSFSFSLSLSLLPFLILFFFVRDQTFLIVFLEEEINIHTPDDDKDDDDTEIIYHTHTHARPNERRISIDCLFLFFDDTN